MKTVGIFGFLDTNGDTEKMDIKWFQRFSFVSHKFPSLSGSYKLQGGKNNLFAKCNFLHDWWLRYLSSGGLKVFHKTIQMQTEVIYSNWNAACHKAMASLVPSVVVICTDRKEKNKTEVHPNFCYHYFETSLLKWWQPTKVCVGDCVSYIRRIFK